MTLSKRPHGDSFQTQTEDQKTRKVKARLHSRIEYLSQIGALTNRYAISDIAKRGSVSHLVSKSTARSELIGC